MPRTNRPVQHEFPFGRPVEAREAARRRGGLFILGAYPSALHVRWTSPDGVVIAALVVDNEPTPFWDGADQEERIEAWKQVVEFRPEWGTVAPVGALNGSSGAWVDANILEPLGFSREQSWITDCLDTYRASKPQIRAVDERFRPFADAAEGFPQPSLPPHPRESAIVREATSDHRARLTRELREAAPTTIVTLGNAALRVLQALVDEDAYSEDRLYSDGYGRRLMLTVDGRSVAWYPLVHPGGRGVVRHAHDEWLLRRSRHVVAARRTCPHCRARGLVRVVYGMPEGQLWQEARRGRIALGGCVMGVDDPDRQCVECGVFVWPDGRIMLPEPWETSVEAIR